MKKVLIIAEAGVNHNGNIDIAKQLIEVAAEASADIVKFQTFQAEALVSVQAQKAQYQQINMPQDQDNSQLAMLKRLELTKESHFELIAHCKKCNIAFLSTAFDLDSLHFLYELDLDVFKIPSGEITNFPYLRQIGGYGRQVILSTGMANMQEIEEAMKILILSGTPKNQITVLHCNTDYPTQMQDVNLKAMLTIQQKLGVDIGYSDHTLGIEVAIASVALGAKVIEKHFTLSRNMEGPDHKASLEPQELKAMVQGIRNIELALSSSGIKEPSPSESKNIAIARKSIHLKYDLPAGHTLSEADFVMKRPATGISPMRMMEVVGRVLTTAKKADEILYWENLI